MVVDNAILCRRRTASDYSPFRFGGRWISYNWKFLGTVVSQYYALDTPRQGLASMVLSGPISDAQSYIQAQWDDHNGSIGSLPPFVQQRIKTLEASKAYDSSEYQAIDDILTTKFTCRTAPLPDCFADAANNVNSEIYVGVQGASEFTIAGVLADLNITHRLSELTDLPVLLTHGTYDTMRPSTVDAIYRALPLGERVLLAKSGHVSMIDEPGKMNDEIADFLDRVELAQSSIFVPKKPINQSLAQCTDGLSSSMNATALVLLVVAVIIIAFLVGIFVGRRGNSSKQRDQYDAL